MLSPAQQQIIEHTYRKLSLNLAWFGDRFYENLFTLHPSARPMFNKADNSQSMKLMQMIGFAVANMQSPQALQPIIGALGQRHVGYGIEKFHYEWVGEALILTLREILKDDFTPLAEEAWNALYKQLVEVAVTSANYP